MTNWIKCSERLPQYNEHVLLVYDKCGDIRNDVFYDPRGKWMLRPANMDYYGEVKNLVTHWMAMPEPPSEDS